MQPALLSMKEMLDHIEQKMKTATYAQTNCVYVKTTGGNDITINTTPTSEDLAIDECDAD